MRIALFLLSLAFLGMYCLERKEPHRLEFRSSCEKFRPMQAEARNLKISPGGVGSFSLTLSSGLPGFATVTFLSGDGLLVTGDMGPFPLDGSVIDKEYSFSGLDPRSPIVAHIQLEGSENNLRMRAEAIIHAPKTALTGKEKMRLGPPSMGDKVAAGR